MRLTGRIKNSIVGAAALLIIVVAVVTILERDEHIMSFSYRWGRLNDTAAIRFTEKELNAAAQFADTTLPGLRQLGLITGYTRTEIETIITVSGKIWNERSEYFKESLLDQLYIYNKVNGFPVKTTIIDDETYVLYAQIVSPDQRLIF